MDGGQKNLVLSEKALPSNFCVGLCSLYYDNVFIGFWLIRFPPTPPTRPTPPTSPSNVVIKKALIFTQFAQNLILFGAGEEGSLV